MDKSTKIQKAYEAAKERYAELGVNTEEVLEKLSKLSISLHCWQGDDVGGFETSGKTLDGGGIQVTGNYPGKARNIDELRADIDKVVSLLPGNNRINLHASYGDFNGSFPDRDKIESKHFQSWVDWAKNSGVKIDFNSTLFSHPKSNDGFTLSSKDKEIRQFWINHVDRCRDISAFLGKELDTTCIHNIWIPDGCKDSPIDRIGHRRLLKESLDQIFTKEINPKYMKDAIESKLFGIGSESYVVGSHEFYLSYGILNKKIVTLDLGHFHPTESVADKISSLLLFSEEIMLHVSRGVRWDSDHVVILNDDIRALAEEIIRCNALDKVYVGLDFFDASINRIGAWVVGTHSTLKGFLCAMLQPYNQLLQYELKGQNFERLALLEECKTLPFGAVWHYYLLKNNLPVAEDIIANIQQYEKDVLSKR